jgi:signal transduction histidine kinase
MFKTLHRRLIASHILPLLVTLPLMVAALWYILETQVLLNNISLELSGQAALVAEMATSQSGLWTDPSRAQAFVSLVGSKLTARLMLISPQGVLLASSDAADMMEIGTRLNIEELALLRTGQAVVTNYGSSFPGEIVDVFVPVRLEDGQVIGIVRLTHHFNTISQRVGTLRYLVIGALIIGLIFGSGVGLVLAFDLERPIRQVTDAVSRLASGKRVKVPDDRGPVEIRALAQSVNMLEDQLDSAEQSRRSLLANLVHELGRPLGALRSANQALLGGADGDPELREELLKGMDYEMTLLQRLLEDLAHLYDQVLGPLELDMKPLKVTEWLPSLLAPWREAALKKGLDWQVELPESLPEINADAYRLAQAVENLISNAIKYTPAGEKVSVSCGSENQEVWIRVTDSGPGISEKDQENIFKPFFRVSHSTRFPQGMGLGLSIARDLVIAHGGHIAIKSEPGQGSTFTIWLPVSS